MMKENLTEEEYNTKTKEMEDILTSTSNKTRENKLKKFERDSRDYRNNNVYKFLKTENGEPEIGQRKMVTWAHPLQSASETSEFDSGSTSGEEQSRSQRPFLDRRSKATRGAYNTRKRPYRGRR